VAPSSTAAVGSQHDVRIQECKQCGEVAATRGGEEGVDDLSVGGEVCVAGLCGALDPAPCAAGRLPGRGRGAPDDRGDLVERHREHVVEHERDPFGRGKLFEHHEHGEADRVGQERFVLRVHPAVAVRDRLVHLRLQRFLTPRLAGAQHVQAHTCHDRRDPPRFPTPLAPERLSRSQDSWTASSASLTEPSMR